MNKSYTKFCKVHFTVVVLFALAIDSANAANKDKNKPGSKKASSNGYSKEKAQELDESIKGKMLAVLNGEDHYTQDEFRYIMASEGDQLNKFCRPNFEEKLKIAKQLGKGGFGIVYEAKYKNGESSVPVAAKFVTYGHNTKKMVLNEIYFLQLFQKSERLISQLICYYQTEEERKKKLDEKAKTKPLTPLEQKERKRPKNKAIIVMKLMSMNLLEWAKKNYQGKIPDNKIAKIFLRCAEAVKEMHDNKIMHRDIKPENFLVADNNQIYLSDYGLSLQSSSSKGQAGTPYFMAPEIFSSQKYSNAVDIYALGVTFYVLISGQPPFNFIQNPKKNPSVAYSQVLNASYFSSLVKKMTSSSAKSRPNIDEVIETIKGVKSKYFSKTGSGGANKNGDKTKPKADKKTKPAWKLLI